MVPERIILTNIHHDALHFATFNACVALGGKKAFLINRLKNKTKKETDSFILKAKRLDTLGDY